MKKNIFTKIMAFFSIAFGAFALSSCQSVNAKEAVVIIEQPEVKIYVETTAAGSKRYGMSTVKVKNNTIYDVIDWTFTITVTDNDDVKKTTSSVEIMPIGHGAQGYITFLEEIVYNVQSVTIDSIVMNSYRNVWQTYLGWWIVGFVIIGVSLAFFSVELFSGHVTKEDATAMFKEHVASMSFAFLFAFVLCLFPLFFGSWVSSLILIGSMLASILVAGLLTWFKALASK